MGTKNLKNRTPDRPNVDFGMTLGIHLGIDFYEILDFVKICANHQNAFKQSISVGLAHPKSYIFSKNVGQNFICFWIPHSGPHFLRFWCDLVPKSLILGAPWRPAGPKMAPKIARVGPKRLQKLSRGKHVEPTCSQYRFRNAPWHHFGWFGMDFEWICIDFGINFKAFRIYFAIRLADCQHRLTRSELTANIKNIQVSAEMCKCQPQTKNADTNTMIDTLQFTKCNQLQHASIFNTGAAVLAPLGAFG